MFSKKLLIIISLFGALAANGQVVETDTTSNVEVDTIIKIESELTRTVAPDTTQIDYDSLDVREFTFNNLKYNYKPISKGVHNTLEGFQLYNPIIQNRLQAFGLGNLGSSYFPARLEDFNYYGFQYWNRDVKSPFMFEPEELTYYTNEEAFSRVDYVGGSKKENYANVVLARNFGEYFNLGFKYTRINSEGFYQKQLNSYQNIAAFSKLYSKDRKYMLLVNGAFNGNTNQENGGIANDSLFELNITDNRKLIPVNLSDAQTRLRKRHAFAYQHYDIGKKAEKPKRAVADTLATDSLTTDSIKVDTVKADIPEGRILRVAHTFKYTMQAFAYDDNNPTGGFYEDVYLDTLVTADSSRIRNLSNTVSLIYFGKKTIDSLYKKNTIALDFSLDNIKISQTLNDTLDTLRVRDNFNNIGGQLKWLNRGKVIDKTAIAASFVFAGYNRSDHTIRVKVLKKFGGIGLQARLNYLQQQPAYFMKQYSSNHFRWLYNFNQVLTRNAGIDFTWDKAHLSVSLDHSSINRFAYLDTLSQPVQSGGEVSVQSVRLNHSVKFGKFQLQTTGIIQNTGGEDILRLPLAIVHETFAYQDKWFKDKLDVRMGVDLFYNTTFYADSYNPALAQFHLQDKKEIGGYPYLDFFFSIRIKKFRAFLKLEHFNSGLMGYEFYQTLHYPSNDRAFKYGISWAFLD